jgi:hypothetical protein
MKIGRLWRTIRHLGPSQIIHRVRLRARRAFMVRFPIAARRRAETRASKLAPADIGSTIMVDIAEIVLAHQTAVHGDHLDGVAHARFMLHNQLFEFGAIENIDWRGEFREGNNPLRRMTLAYMGYIPPLLARGRAGDLALAVRIVRSFDEGNQWGVVGVLGDAWHPYTASHRLINLLAGLALYGKAGGPVDVDAEDEILRHARLCAAHISANLERDVQYNHLMKNLVALSVYGTELAKGSRRSVAQCVLADGGHAERSPMYHLLALLDLRILRACGLEFEFVAKMETALRIMTHPDGEIALFNDSWVGEAPPPSELIPPGEIPEIATLEKTGYTRLGRGGDTGRSGDAVIFDHGPCGPDDNPAHAHADFLSVEISVGGQRLIVDPGVATYTAGDMRQATRSAASHNGPQIVGQDTLELWGSFRVARRARAGALVDPALAGFAPLHCAGWHDGYRSRNIGVRRFVGLWPGAGVLLCDLWIGGAGAAGKSRFLVPADWRIIGTAPLAFERNDVTLHMEALIGIIEDVEPGQYWPRFEMPGPAHEITLTPDPVGPDMRAALWVSWDSSAAKPDNEALARLFDALARAEGGS